MKLLVLDTGMIVTCGEYVETETEFLYSGLTVPKDALPENYQQVEVDVPADFQIYKYKYIGGQLELIPEETTQTE